MNDSLNNEGKYKGFERAESLITVTELKKYRDTPSIDLVIIAVANMIDYRLGHIPGSVRVWRPDYVGNIDESYPSGGMILSRDSFEKFARGLGVNNDSIVVIYDHELDATRLWWAFYLYGKRDVRVLDGGFQAWKQAGYKTNFLAPSKPKPGNFNATAPISGWSASMSDVWLCKSDQAYQLWDTREEDEWAGQKLMWGAHRKGRIPWAKFLNWKEFKRPTVAGENPTEFKSAVEIQKVIEENGIDREKNHVFYCQVGVRTTVNMFALYLMGWDPAKLHNYDGSWAEWSYYDQNPIIIEN
ncbi:MAG: sulfurtransferase [Candidatus Scalindua sp. AMX11]|nr:MAG: sulfurtransferase [Candidatus Scalindua sp.]NOG82275.1 sulfurtransferase [Planctomycetota bacterium]RZV71434.1 MAG: sulfurtransferase [Candidatus Scalindua sp. SCAELEC01]TDE64302.1 MAG: sulfurtransferase [Candidatus Scalindua sp. AMX11]GJQ59944.1 MAG: sulfurtransferase [Candidatus Scalindua sp.]